MITLPPNELAKSLGHSDGIINLYNKIKEETHAHNSEDIAELDIIYFLKNILWSTNFELIAKIIVDYGMESRLDQWREAIEELSK